MKKYSVPTLSYLMLVFAGIFTLGACSFSKNSTTDTAQSTALEQPAAESEGTKLDCEVEGYPCSYADADPQVLEESFEALNEAALAIEEGESIEDAVKVLQNRNDLAELIYEPEGIRFRLDNGPPMWVFNGDAITGGTKGPGFGSSAKDPIHSGDLDSPLLQSGEDDGPIGESKRGEEPFKKALLLSPLWWEFEIDEVIAIQSILENSHRNYRCDNCQVEVKRNTIPDQRDDESDEEYELNKPRNIKFEVTLDDFKSWDQYDLIHLSTHGSQFCKEVKCVGMLMTGQFIELVDYQSGIELFYSQEPGLVWGRAAVPGCGILKQKMNDDAAGKTDRAEAKQDWINKGCGIFTNRYWQLVEPDFFRYYYQNAGKPLDDKLIFFSACESMKDFSLAKSVAGKNTTVYGWSETVDLSGGAYVAIDFYQYYVKKGLRAEVAFDKVKDDLIKDNLNPVLRRYQPKGVEIESILPPEFLQDGEENTRGREIITLMQPIYREELEELDAIPTIGAAGDGENDDLLFLIQVDGIDEDQNPDDFVIHIAVDGVELDETFKPREKIDEYSYWTLDVVSLPFDAADRDYVELEAWVDLPEGGESRHVLEEVELANCGWTGTLSGSRSGQIEGDIVFPSIHLSAVDINRLSLLAGEGILGMLGEEESRTETLANLPRSVMMGSREQFPFLMVIPGQAANAMLEENTLGIGGNQTSLNLSEETEQRVEGSFSAELTELTTQQQYSIQGDLIWHVDSFCSLDVMMELVENPLPAGLAP